MKAILNNITHEEVLDRRGNPINDDGTVVNKIRKDGVQLITYWEYYTGYENFGVRAISSYRKRYMAIDIKGKEYKGDTRAQTLHSLIANN